MNEGDVKDAAGYAAMENQGHPDAGSELGKIMARAIAEGDTNFFKRVVTRYRKLVERIDDDLPRQRPDWVKVIAPVDLSPMELMVATVIANLERESGEGPTVDAICDELMELGRSAEKTNVERAMRGIKEALRRSNQRTAES